MRSITKTILISFFSIVFFILINNNVYAVGYKQDFDNWGKGTSALDFGMASSTGLCNYENSTSTDEQRFSNNYSMKLQNTVSNCIGYLDDWIDLTYMIYPESSGSRLFVYDSSKDAMIFIDFENTQTKLYYGSGGSDYDVYNYNLNLNQWNTVIVSKNTGGNSYRIKINDRPISNSTTCMNTGCGQNTYYTFFDVLFIDIIESKVFYDDINSLSGTEYIDSQYIEELIEEGLENVLASDCPDITSWDQEMFVGKDNKFWFQYNDLVYPSDVYLINPEHPYKENALADSIARNNLELANYFTLASTSWDIATGTEIDLCIYVDLIGTSTYDCLLNQNEFVECGFKAIL